MYSYWSVLLWQHHSEIAKIVFEMRIQYCIRADGWQCNATAGAGWAGVGCDGSECERRMQARRWMQNRTVQSLASSELACPPRVTPVVMQLQSEEGRNISLKCRVTGRYTYLSLRHLRNQWFRQSRLRPSLYNLAIVLCLEDNILTKQSRWTFIWKVKGKQ